jgi:NADH dehydrogenase
MFGSGDYLVQPIYAGDLAELAGEAGVAEDNLVVDAVGPETYTFEALVRQVRKAVGSRARILRLPAPAAFLLVRLLSLLVRDVLLTREEVEGLMANLLVSNGPPTGRTSLRAWLDENATGLGRRYASELDRHFRR